MKKQICVSLVACILLTLVGCKQQADEAPPPAVTQNAFRIEYEFSMLSNDCVGNDWKTTVTYREQPIQSGDIITDPPGTTIVLCGTVTESDRFPDTGSGCVHLTLGEDTSGAIEITVQENRGRYAGNTAVWRFQYRITQNSE